MTMCLSYSFAWSDVFWYDSENPPLTVSNWGMPNHIIDLAGGENIFKDIQKKEAMGDGELGRCNCTPTRCNCIN
ncbi:MAG: hypothetical protein HC907_34320 [Richelia sp. SM1_7_0]|nr:hypothetical protein [Richelia sp. SM1_7_0]